MKGKWTGKYWFSGNVPNNLKDRKTDFELIVDNCLDSKISGQISDKIETGGTAGIGSFSGTVSGNEINFVKRMPIRTSVFRDGTKIEEEKPHRPIYYSGIIDLETNSIHGTWKFKIGIGFLKGRLVFYPNTKGEWEMKRV
jgi:hypothetical protein